MLYVPRIDNYYLDLKDVRDPLSIALVDNKYPFSSKNSINNLGSETRKFNVSCTFQENPTTTKGWGDNQNYSIPTYNEYFFFIDYIRNNLDLKTFVHPAHGEISGHVKNINSLHKDWINFAEVTFEFWEQSPEVSVFNFKYVVSESATNWQDTNNSVTSKTETEEKNAIDPITWEATAQTFISKLNNYLNSVESQANSIINTINYGTSTPGQMLSSINSAIDRIIETYKTTKNSPASFINNIIFGCRELKALYEGVEADKIHIMSCSRCAYEAAIVYEEDESKRQEVITKEGQSPFDINGVYKGKIEIPVTMSLNELEESVYEVRAFIDEAIQIDRDNTPLKQSARDLQDYINNIKLERERIKTLSDVPLQTLHEIVVSNGNNFLAANRILKLNPNIKNPTFVSGDVNILVRPENV